MFEQDERTEGQLLSYKNRWRGSGALQAERQNSESQQKRIASHHITSRSKAEAGLTLATDTPFSRQAPPTCALAPLRRRSCLARWRGSRSIRRNGCHSLSCFHASIAANSFAASQGKEGVSRRTSFSASKGEMTGSSTPTRANKRRSGAVFLANREKLAQLVICSAGMPSPHRSSLLQKGPALPP